MNMMKSLSFFRIVAATPLRILIITTLLSGCGQKGPLYYPVPPAAQEAETSNGSTELADPMDRKDDKKATPKKNIAL